MQGHHTGHHRYGPQTGGSQGPPGTHRQPGRVAQRGPEQYYGQDQSGKLAKKQKI